MYFYLKYEGTSEGYFIVKVDSIESARAWFYENITILFHTTDNEISFIEEAEEDEIQYCVNEEI